MPSALLLLVRTREKGGKENRLSLLGKGNRYRTSHLTRKHTQKRPSLSGRSEVDHAHYLPARGGIAYHPPPRHRKFSKARAGIARSLLLNYSDASIRLPPSNGDHGEASPLGGPERPHDPPGGVAPRAGVRHPPGPTAFHKVAQGAAAVVRRRLPDSILG